jgi:transposase
LAGERAMRYTRQRMNTTTQSSNSQLRGEQVAKKLPRLLLGLDVHADSIRVVRILDGAGPQPAQKFTPPAFLEWMKKQVALAECVDSCYEAGPFGYGLHRQLTALGVHNLVVRPRTLDEYAKRVNTDATDALALAQRLDRYTAGNRYALAVVRVPTTAEEQKRVVSRQRQQLKNEERRLAAQGRSLLLSQGWRTKGPWWQPRRWTALSAQLPEWLQRALAPLRTVLLIVAEQLRAVTTALEEAAPAQRPKGLGGLTYEAIEREVGDWNRFQNRRQVASYTGLCAGVSSSGLSTRMLPITKHGNPRLRAALIELAWRMVLYQRQSRAVQKWQQLLLKDPARRGARKKAIVALARQMAVDLWRWRTGRAAPETLGWQMNG